jgi:hypothetical protein
MARLALIASVAALAALGPLAASAPAALKESGIELVDGSGQATLTLRGALLGGLERGRLAIAIRAGREQPEILVLGADWERVLDSGTTVYGGRELRFRVFRGAWRVRITGSGINASAVGKGTVGLRGRGRYALAGAAYRAWPAEYQAIRLGD